MGDARRGCLRAAGPRPGSEREAVTIDVRARGRPRLGLAHTASFEDIIQLQYGGDIAEYFGRYVES